MVDYADHSRHFVDAEGRTNFRRRVAIKLLDQQLVRLQTCRVTVHTVVRNQEQCCISSL